jgi:LacI family transcriptional regulator
VKYLVKHGASAVQVSNDHVAVRLMKAAIKNGIKVPADLSVVGFDDSEIGHCSEVPLTTIKQDFFSMGYRAAKILCGIIKGKRAKITEFIPLELIKRESTDYAAVLK